VSEMFEEEEELRQAIEELGRIHDCREAGCDRDPGGKAIPDEAAGQARPEPGDRVKELWLKIRGYEYPG